nr:MAG TPA_asm: hypothetical protein [Caudoviricetes sp.]
MNNSGISVNRVRIQFRFTDVYREARYAMKPFSHRPSISSMNNQR